MASEDFDFSSDGEAEDEKDEFVPDPATVAFLDQESAAFAEIADEFYEVYSFKHDCKCDEDYAAGRVGEVTECYAGMIVEALATCARLTYENNQLKAMVTALADMTENVLDAKESDGLEAESNGIEFLDNPETGDGEADSSGTSDSTN